jgi:seryl-tRNA synthetase
MLDLTFIKENKELVLATINSRKLAKKVDLEAFLLDYEAYLALLRNVETHRGLRNKLSEDISKINGGERDKLIKEATEVKKELQESEGELEKLKAKIDEVLKYIPNVNSDDMPLGKGEEDNEIIKVWNPGEGYYKKGQKFSYTDISYAPKEEFAHKDHVELGESLGIIDIEQSGKVSGSRFYYLKDEAVLILDAVFSLLKKKLLEMGYRPMMPPAMVKERSLFGTSHFPEGKDQVYKIENKNVEEGNELYLVGSSEPPNFSYFMDKILSKEELPIKIFAKTTCFRSEVGSWGKDVKGIKRVHQFDKLEMNAVCAEGQDRKIFDEFLEINEWLYQSLELPYRVVNKCSGDCGYSASHFQYDIEVWRPGVNEYMELGTNTMTTDYQARRLNIRYRDGNKTQYARTVNDTGASTRPLIALLENHQNKDGSVNVPKSLVSFTGFDKMLPKDNK